MMRFILTCCVLGLFATAADAFADDTNAVGSVVANKVPLHWVFGRGKAELLEGGAACGRQFVRIKDREIIHQEINQPADFRGDLLIRAKVRGKGALAVYIYHYERNTRKNAPSVMLKEIKVDSREWMPIDATCKCNDDQILRLAFHANGGAIDIDDVSVTRE